MIESILSILEKFPQFYDCSIPCNSSQFSFLSTFFLLAIFLVKIWKAVDHLNDISISIKSYYYFKKNSEDSKF